MPPTRGEEPEPGRDGGDTTPLSRYDLLTVLGRGGMGEVWRAEDRQTGEIVAVKRLDEARAYDDGMRERFFREAGVLSRLKHPNIVEIKKYDADRSGRLFLVMEFVNGQSLADHLQRHGRLDPATALEMVKQLASALDSAHREGVIHRDVKPFNVLLDEAGPGLRMVLIDFGIAWTVVQAVPRQTGRFEIIGSPEYMAPERWQLAVADGDGAGGRAVPVGPRSDVYSLCVVFFEMLTGQPPYRGTWQELMKLHGGGPIPRPSQRRADLPAALDAVVARAMAANPDDRYATATEFVEEAEAALTGAVRTPPARGRRRRPRAAFVAVGVAAVVLAGGIWFATRPPTLRAEATVDVGAAATGAVAVVAGRAFVGTEGNLVVVVDLPTRTVVGRVDVPGPPRDMTVSADGSTVYVSTGDATVTSIDTAGLTATGRHPIPRGSGRIAVAGSGAVAQVYGAGDRDGYVFVPASPAYRALGFGAPPSDVGIGDGRGYFLVADDGSGHSRLDVVDTSGQQTLDPIRDLPLGATDVAVTANGTVYVAGSASVTAVDGGSGTPRVVPLGSADPIRSLTVAGDDLYVVTGTGTVLLVRGGAVATRTSLPHGVSAPAGIAAGADGCVAVISGTSEVDLLGSGSSCGV